VPAGVRHSVGISCDTMAADNVSEDTRRLGLLRCQEFLGGAWTLATDNQFNMEYIR